MRYLPLIVIVGTLAASTAEAHGFAGSGWLHPLTGPDHMLAMLAVGAWSAQLGGRALYTVPSAFVLAMAIGGACGLTGVFMPGTELMIALSVLILGAAILLNGQVAWPFAVFATVLFGTAHGWAHGRELQGTADPVTYVFGFLVTTAGLHIAGAVAAMLLMEHPGGLTRLRAAGAAVATAGIALTAMAIST